MLNNFGRRAITLIFAIITMFATFWIEAAELKIVYPANGLYSLQPMCAPSKELTVHNASMANGANVIIWDINSNWHTQKSHQKWNVQRIGNTEWYKILAENSGLALNIHNGIAANGTNVSIWPFGGNMHKFRFLNAGNGYYVLQGHVDGAYVLDVSGASNTNGANVQIYQFNNSAAQKWKLVKRNPYVLKGDVDGNGKVELADLNLLQKYLVNTRIYISKNNSDLNGDGKVTITDVAQLKSKLNQNNDRVVILVNGWYKILSANSLGKGIDVNSSGTSDGSNIILYQHADTNNQKFYLENKGSGWFTLKAGHCDKYVSAANATGNNYTNIQINTKNNNNTQLWRLIDAGNGYYYIESKLKQGLSFDCANGSSANSTNIQLWSRGNVLWNKWKFTKVSAPVVENKYVKLNVPYFKQNDNRWKNTKIGTKTIGQVGCLLTCLSMKHSYHTNQTITPDVMKNNVSFSNNDFKWASLNNFGYIKYDKNSKMTNSLMKEIYQALKNNKPVIVGHSSIHWVLVYGYSGNDTVNFDVTKFNIWDPATANRTNLKQFLDAKTSIIQRIIY